MDPGLCLNVQFSGFLGISVVNFDLSLGAGHSDGLSKYTFPTFVLRKSLKSKKFVAKFIQKMFLNILTLISMFIECQYMTNEQGLESQPSMRLSTQMGDYKKSKKKYIQILEGQKRCLITKGDHIKKKLQESKLFLKIERKLMDSNKQPYQLNEQTITQKTKNK